MVFPIIENLFDAFVQIIECQGFFWNKTLNILFFFTVFLLRLNGIYFCIRSDAKLSVSCVIISFLDFGFLLLLGFQIVFASAEVRN